MTITYRKLETDESDFQRYKISIRFSNTEAYCFNIASGLQLDKLPDELFKEIIRHHIFDQVTLWEIIDEAKYD